MSAQLSSGVCALCGLYAVADQARSTLRALGGLMEESCTSMRDYPPRLHPAHPRHECKGIGVKIRALVA